LEAPTRSLGRGGRKLAYDTSGDGFPIVLHTGAGGDSRMWREGGYVDGLAGYLAVLIDHCGHGESDAADDPASYTPASYAADVLAVVDELGCDRFGFIGYSNGARVGYELAAGSVARVAALVGIGGVDPPDVDPEELHAAAQAVRAGGIVSILANEPAPEWLLTHLADTPAEVVAREFEGFAHWSPWRLFERIVAPTLIVAGEHEAEAVADAVQALPRGTAAVLPGLGHLKTFAAAEVVLAEVLPFLCRALG
jgi:pimeloyl-ACP methyl ester carboxylesterase